MCSKYVHIHTHLLDWCCWNCFHFDFHFIYGIRNENSHCGCIDFLISITFAVHLRKFTRLTFPYWERKIRASTVLLWWDNEKTTISMWISANFDRLRENSRKTKNNMRTTTRPFTAFHAFIASLKNKAIKFYFRQTHENDVDNLSRTVRLMRWMILKFYVWPHFHTCDFRFWFPFRSHFLRQNQAGCYCRYRYYKYIDKSEICTCIEMHVLNWITRKSCVYKSMR